MVPFVTKPTIPPLRLLQLGYGPFRHFDQMGSSAALISPSTLRERQPILLPLSAGIFAGYEKYVRAGGADRCLRDPITARKIDAMALNRAMGREGVSTKINGRGKADMLEGAYSGNRP